MSDIAIKVKNLTKQFVLPHQRVTSVKSKVVSLFKKFDAEAQLAVNDVSFEVKKGEFFGIVGRNGSGKSTLLKCLAGVYTPNKGSITINGNLVPFIELGVGFNPELSGRDNVFLNGALLGFSRHQMEAMYDKIVEFAELEEFMDQKLKNYSSGMQVRLAFSIAIRAEGDILLLDEVLAVGDAAFQQKCYTHFQQLKRDKKTVLFVSHDTNSLRQFCTNGILLEGGKIISQGSIKNVLNDYTDIVSKQEAKSLKTKDGRKRRMGTGKMEVKKVITKDGSNKPKTAFSEELNIIVEVEFQAKVAVSSPAYGLVITDPAGVRVFASNNIWQSLRTNDLKSGEVQKVVWSVPNIFSNGEYSISPAAADFSGKEVYDTVDDMALFTIRKTVNSSAVTNPSHQMSIAKPVKK